MSVEEREAPRDDVPYFALRPMGYEKLKLERGQVFRLQGCENDALLVDLKFIALAPVPLKSYACRICSREFVSQSERDAHGRRMHETRKFTPPPPPEMRPGESKQSFKNRLDAWALEAGRLADAEDERAAKEADAAAPLDLTKTAASRK